MVTVINTKSKKKFLNIELPNQLVGKKLEIKIKPKSQKKFNFKPVKINSQNKASQFITDERFL
jgi:hypothetical protein